MNIVFYSTYSNFFNSKSFRILYFPSCKTEFDKLAKLYPEHEFIVVTQQPGMFLIDNFSDGDILKSKNIKYHILTSEKKYSAEEFANIILSYSPSLAIPLSFWTNPLDWLSLKDSLVSEFLNSKGIKSFSIPSQSALISFDKNLFNQKINELILNNKIQNLKIPKTVYIHHELFWIERNKKDVNENVYKEFIFSQLKKLNFPVIIKDNFGLSSYGMEVATTYNQLISFLCSKRNNSDRVVQEYIEGFHFGTEIYSSNINDKKEHFVFSPFIFSLNKYGITSPKQSVKIGPINRDNFKIDELKKSLLQLSSELNFSGITQVDLIYKNNQWYILEINPRLSGMTKTYLSIIDKTIPQLFMELMNKKELFLELNNKKGYVINFKLPILSDKNFKRISSYPYVKSIKQMHNMEARQEREKGFCEVVLGTASDFRFLQNIFKDFIECYKDLIDEDLLQGAFELFDLLRQN